MPAKKKVGTVAALMAEEADLRAPKKGGKMANLGFTQTDLANALKSKLASGVKVAMYNQGDGGLAVTLELVGTAFQVVSLGPEVLPDGIAMGDAAMLVLGVARPEVRA